MAPEQVEGKAVGSYTDIYALGVVMYEMVTGTWPFTGDPISMAVRRLKEKPAPPRRHVADLDPRWEEVILRCLERDPADRFESADDVARALDSGPMASSRRRRRHRTRAAAAALLLLALVTVVGVTRSRWWPSPVSGREGSAPAATATLGLVVASGAPLVTPGSIAVSPDGETLYVGDWGANAIFSVQARGETPTVLASLSTTGFRGLDRARLMAISPDGATLYVAGWNTASVFSVSTTTGAARMLASGPPLERPHGMAVSSDGAILFVTDNFGGKLFRLSSEGGAPELFASGLPTPEDVAPAGATLFVTGTDGSLIALEGETPVPRRIVTEPPLVRPTGLVVSPELSTLYIVDDAAFADHPPAAVYSLPVGGGALELVFSGPPLLLSTPAFDATEVDPATVQFGPRRAAETHGRGHEGDVDGDGDVDLLLHFPVAGVGLTCGESEVSLRGRTFRGERIQGRDAVTTPGCR